MNTSNYFQKVSCPLCGKTGKRVYPVDTDYAFGVSGVPVQKEKPGVARCCSCGHQFIQPCPTSAFLSLFYSAYMSNAKSGFY